MFDVAFMTNLPVTRRRVKFHGEEISGDLGRIVREHMAEIVAAKRGKWKCQKEGRRNILWNYIRPIFDLCNKNSEKASIRVWMQLFIWMVLSGLFFPRTPYSAAWSLKRYADDVQHLGEYTWSEAIWRFVFPLMYMEFTGVILRAYTMNVATDVPRVDDPAVAEAVVEVPSGQQPTIGVPEPEHTSVQVPPSVDPRLPAVMMMGRVHPNQVSQEPVRKCAEQGQTDSVEDPIINDTVEVIVPAPSVGMD
ncbi:hypothetical protein Cgig2_010647 [Carnegiea gigantea]|uniref:Uncharacterized protein n=1 Tax=Carnegiea gigantea TaxID=171969 RepID=A0A9Q1Q560_9CARY|nr:hypothetical protein Cgig2_010647 [Carnegiea gigantea]